MYKQDYMSMLEVIRRKVKKGNIKNVDRELDKLYEVKPVRLKWFVVKAELMLRQGRSPEEILELLEGKYHIFHSYPCQGEALDLCARAYQMQNKALEAKRLSYIRHRLTENNSGERNSYLNQIEESLEIHRSNFLQDFQDVKNIWKLAQDYYITWNWIPYSILSFISNQLEMPDEIVIEEGLDKKFWNYSYLRERICSDSDQEVIIIADAGQPPEDCEVVINALRMLEKPVHFIDLPNRFSVDKEIELQDTLAISLDQTEYYEGLTVYHPVAIEYDGRNIGDNRDYIMLHIMETSRTSDLMLVMCIGSLFEEICRRPNMHKCMGRLSDIDSELLENCLCFGWFGNYLTYISHIYKTDVEEKMNSKAEYKYSIVIPARNSSKTLRYTLKTCLSQRYASDKYEVIVSDNSLFGATEIFDLCRELRDPRIKYYKTPRNLGLQKSFEYAMLQAKGEFVFSIGSDDAVLPWTFEILDYAMEKFPNEDVIQWDRGFYVWPEFTNGQQNEFIIPAGYKKGEAIAYYKNQDEYMEMILNIPGSMYGLPMLYINSGFRRRYLHKLIEKTGCLWDAASQDIYMGITNIALNKKILNIAYPLTIAGMSGKSLGGRSHAGLKNQQEIRDYMNEIESDWAMGLSIDSKLERSVPSVQTDVDLMHRSIIRAIIKGVLPKELLYQQIDWKKMFTDIIKVLSVDDLMYDSKIERCCYAAGKHGQEYLEWFQKEVYPKAMSPRVQQNQETGGEFKIYEERKYENGGETLDASRFGVTNVAEAAVLFETLTGL